MTRALVLITALAACGAAQAAGVGIRAGTTGIGADVAWGIAPTLSARVGYSALKWGYDADTSDASYDGDLELSNLSGMLDFHPFGPAFRITGGVIINDNKYRATGRPSGFAGSFDATVEPGRRAAPYIGIGWGNVAGAGINFYADLGVMFMGSPKARLRADCGGLSAGQCATLQNEVAAEEARLEDELKHFKAFPVLNIGLTIGF
ncbi:MAG TPA: hypothetical protein VF211_00170 [Burkholderiales bacterium]